MSEWSQDENNKSDSFDDLVELDIEWPFFGVDNNKFKIGHLVFEVCDDPDDGYRSYLDSVLVDTKTDHSIFFKSSLDIVRLKKLEEDEYKLVSTRDGHVWLEFGTDRIDDYYPTFYFNYSPRENQ
jgi:hypothetical protein